MSNQDGIELRWILGVMRRWWWLIALCAILATGAAFYFVSRMPPSYEATATLLIEPAPSTKADDYSALMTGERLALTYSEMIKGQTILQDVISALGLKETTRELSRRVAVVPVKSTQLIRLTVKDTSADQAALVANAIAEALSRHVQILQGGRYTTSLADMQTKLTSLSTLIEEVQAKIHTQSAIKNTEQAELDRLEGFLSESGDEMRTLQANLQSLQLAKAQLAENIKVVEPAQVHKKPSWSLHTASVTLFIRQLTVSGQGDYSMIMASERLALTYSQMLAGQSVLKAAIAKLGLTITSEELAKRVTAEPVPDTQLIQLFVEDLDASRAALLADTIAETFIAQILELQVKPYVERLDSLQRQIDDLSAQAEATQAEIKTRTAKKVQAETELANLEGLLAGYRSDYRALQQDYEQLRLAAAQAADAVVITEPAQAPDQPAQHQTRYILLAAVVSIMAGLGFTFLLEYLNDTIRTPEDASRLLGVEVLGAIGVIEKGTKRLEVATRPRSPAAEDFRKLVTSLRFASADGSLRTLLVTSPNPREGKTMIVANLAIALMQTEVNVIMVDADLRLPHLHQLFGVDQSNGLAESFLKGNIDGNLQNAATPKLRVLTSGEPPPNPAEVVGSPRMKTLLDQLSQQADLVLIDCPPVLPVADTLSLASKVDGVLLIVRAGQTRLQAAREAVESLRQAGARLVGVVLNAAPRRSGKYYYYRHPQHGREKASAQRSLWKRSADYAAKLLKKERTV